MSISALTYIVVSMRPKQWVKNFFVFAALLFAREFTNANIVVLAVLAFAIFCLASSGVYFLNDVADREYDRMHPKKSVRPIAAGRIGVMSAVVIGFVLLFFSGISAFLMNSMFGFTVLGYITLNLLYSFSLKNIVIVDVIAIAFGFVLRVIGGAVAINVTFSPWLIFCTFFLTLFLAVSKRRNELLLSHDTRKVLGSYSLIFLDQMNNVVLPLTLVTYTFYTFSSEHGELLMLTVPVVLYGMFRYLYIAERKQVSDDGPVDDLFSDKSLVATIAVWVLMVIVILWYSQ